MPLACLASHPVLTGAVEEVIQTTVLVQVDLDTPVVAHDLGVFG
jgi:hypothetical protein